MVKCNSQKCKERQRKIIDKIMEEVPFHYRFDYESAKSKAKPHITKKEWKDWLERQPQ